MSHTLEEEDRLITEAQQGSEKAFAALFQLHYPFLYKYMIKLTMNPSLAEDIIQETMLKSYMNINRYDRRSRFSSWLITIATRTYVDMYRKKKRERLFLKRASNEMNEWIRWRMKQSSPEYFELADVLLDLDPIYRLPLLLKHYYGYTYEEIAKMLSIKEGTVKSRVHKAIRMTRKELNRDE
ncbi:MAG: RNA polymerase sigma factor SigY [Bacillus sp. (in: firmicutes)]